VFLCFVDELVFEVMLLWEFVVGLFVEGWIIWFEFYEVVYCENVEFVFGCVKLG